MSLGTSTVEKTSTVRKLAPRYKVLLHNDEFNSMEFVVEVLMQTIGGMTQPQAGQYHDGNPQQWCWSSYHLRFRTRRILL